MSIRWSAKRADSGSSAAWNWSPDKTTKRSFDAQHGVGAAAVRFAEEEGLIVRSVLGDVMTLSPPLVISAPEIEELFDRLARALDKTLDWATRERLAAA